MNTTKKIAVVLAVMMVAAAMAAPAVIGVTYQANVLSGINVYICDGPYGDFGDVTMCEPKSIYSFGLNNTGNVNATVDARFTSNDTAGVYGLVNATYDSVIPADNFDLEAVDLGGAPVLLNSTGAYTIILPELPWCYECWSYNASLHVPLHTPAGEYTGIVELRFTAVS